MRNTYREIADEKNALIDEENRLKEELMRLALAQNPELAKKLIEVTSKQIDNRERANRTRIEEYLAWKKEQEEKERAENPRKIKYDDGRNINALKGIRRRCDYKYGTRLEQINMEIRDYYTPFNQPIPQALLNEKKKLELATQVPPLMGFCLASSTRAS